MRPTRALVPTLTNDLFAARDNASHRRIWLRRARAALRQFHRTRHRTPVEVGEVTFARHQRPCYPRAAAATALCPSHAQTCGDADAAAASRSRRETRRHP